jgi:hypothetical protein
MQMAVPTSTACANRAAAPRADRLIACGVAATIVVVLAETTAQLVDYAAYDLRVHALNSNADGGVFGIVGDAALAVAACAAWLLAAVAFRHRAAIVLLPPLITFLAIDKAARLHDHVPHYVIVYLPVLTATFVTAAAVAHELPRRIRRVIGIGLVLLAGSYLLHQFGETLLTGLGASPDGWIHQVKAIIKHCAEVAGWMLIAVGLAAGAQATSATTARR